MGKVPGTDGVTAHEVWQAKVCDVYRQERPALLAYLRRRLKGEDPEDVVSEAFARVLSAGPDRVRSPRHYLWATVGNALTDRYRQRATEQRSVADYVDVYQPSNETVASSEELVWGRTRLASVLDAIVRLPEEACLALLLARFDGLTVREIAGMLGRPRSTVFNQLTYATQACRRAADG